MRKYRSNGIQSKSFRKWAAQNNTVRINGVWVKRKDLK
jgi:hypothetical protein